jgi:hypothetical protein
MVFPYLGWKLIWCLITNLNVLKKLDFLKIEMWFNSVYCFFVFINVFNIFGQEHLHKTLFHFLHVIPKAIIDLFSLASSEVKLDLVI